MQFFVILLDCCLAIALYLHKLLCVDLGEVYESCDTFFLFLFLEGCLLGFGFHSKSLLIGYKHVFVGRKT